MCRPEVPCQETGARFFRITTVSALQVAYNSNVKNAFFQGVFLFAAKTRNFTHMKFHLCNKPALALINSANIRAKRAQLLFQVFIPTVHKVNVVHGAFAIRHQRCNNQRCPCTQVACIQRCAA